MALHKKTTFEIAFVINALVIARGEANVTRGVLEKSDTFRSARAWCVPLYAVERRIGGGGTGPGPPCC